MCCYIFYAERHHHTIRSLHTESCGNNKHGCPSTNSGYSKKLSIVKLQLLCIVLWSSLKIFAISKYSANFYYILYICFDLEFSHDPPRDVGQPNQLASPTFKPLSKIIKQRYIYFKLPDQFIIFIPWHTIICSWHLSTGEILKFTNNIIIII